MPSLRQEVHEFVRADETLLSPASIDAPLSKEEIKIVEFYASSLTDFCAMEVTMRHDYRSYTVYKAQLRRNKAVR